MTKEKGFSIIEGGRGGKTAAMQKALDQLFDMQPMARVLLAKADGTHEIIEGTTFEDVTNTNHGIEQHERPLLGSGTED